MLLSQAMDSLVKSVGLAPIILVGSFVLCLASGYLVSTSTWAELFTLWKFLAVGCVGFILGKIFH